MLTNFGVVEPGFYRCAQPDAKGLADLYQLGVRLILKLNDDATYPLEREQREFGGEVLDFGLQTLTPDRGVVKTAVATIDRRRPRSLGAPDIAVHCSHGRDRTGLVIGAWRLLCCGWTVQQVEAERRLYGNVWILDVADREIVECLEAISRGA